MSRVALVTGGSRGIGRASCLALAESGWDVAVGFRKDAGAADEVVEAVRARGRRAVAVGGTIEDADAAAEVVATVQQELGTVGALVHSAGIASRGNLVADTDPAEVLRVFGVHALAAHHLCRLVVPGMRELGDGRVVLVSSIVSRVPRPRGAPYVMAKAALELLGETLAMEERANGIRVNVVAPGLVATDMGDKLGRATLGVDRVSELDAMAPFGRVCRPEDVATVISFLASPAADYVTGQRICVDGGESWGWWGP